jgi:hypothetical protein
MDRRRLVQAGWMLAVGTAAGADVPALVDVPVLRVTNRLAKSTAAERRAFEENVWKQAVAEFAQSGVRLQVAEREGEIRKSPSGHPLFSGLERGKVNIVLTDFLPLEWDNGRYGAGLSTIYEGFHLCLIAMNVAHGNRVPFLNVNTLVHELLHLFLGDVFVRRPGVVSAHRREARVDWHATRLWLFQEGAAVKQAAHRYVRRLRASAVQ